MESEIPKEDYFAKLELVKEVRQKTITAEKMRLHMKDLMDELRSEEGTLSDYQTELELLTQEKMAHVEELRLIHTDINTMEDLTKQAKAARKRLIDEIRKTHEEFLPIKNELNEMRDTIGLASLDEVDNVPSILKVEEAEISDVKPSLPDLPPLDMSMPTDRLSGRMLLSTLSKPAVRQQQPAPMKSCQSCHQLIHRNAPICPLCKAKSRSRNPKKARRKHDV